jgi:hypothetical protein
MNGIRKPQAKTKTTDMRDSLLDDVRDAVSQIYGDTTDYSDSSPERDFRNKICCYEYNIIQAYSAAEVKQRYNELKTHGNLAIVKLKSPEYARVLDALWEQAEAYHRMIVRVLGSIGSV